MSFADDLINEASYTHTLNGAVTHATTTDECLDFFAVAGGMRYRRESDQIKLFMKAYIANPELATKLLFYIRDIRGGLGERKMFRTLICYLAKMWPDTVRKNIHLISEYGRWDDIICLLQTSVKDAVVNVIRKQLEKDLLALEERKEGNYERPISLMAKWLPSDNTSSKERRAEAKILYEALGLTRKEYRKKVVALRKELSLTENYLTKQKYNSVDYESVPAHAMFKYRKAFAEKDGKRFDKYLNMVSNKNRKINCSTIDPYELLRPYFNESPQVKYLNDEVVKYLNDEVKIDRLIETMWKNIPANVNNENSVVVVDTSGSMYCGFDSGQIPALISQALGIYYAEHCKGIFHNKIITFSERPSVMEIKGETLRDKLFYLQSAPWGFSTNMESVFDLILNTAIRTKAKKQDLPSVIYIISDMEFNCAVNDPQKTVYDNAKARFEKHGYELPAVVFHNVNSWCMQAPVGAHTRGAALVSGSGTSSFGHKFDGNTTPLSHMLEVLGSKRYEPIHA